jgi:hypothetical protein
MPAAEQALRLYRKFRGSVSFIHSQLRHITFNHDGRLVLTDNPPDEGKKDDYFGPRGFKNAHREIDFGLLAGTRALGVKYDPVTELKDVIRRLEAITTFPTEEARVNFICGMSDAERTAAVAILKGADDGAAKFSRNLNEFVSFFTPENVALLNRFGNHPHNPAGFGARFDYIHGRPRLTIHHGKTNCFLQMESDCHDFRFHWPQKIQI